MKQQTTVRLGILALVLAVIAASFYTTFSEDDCRNILSGTDIRAINIKQTQMCWMEIEENQEGGIRIGVYNISTSPDYWRCDGLKEMCLKRLVSLNGTMICSWSEYEKVCRCGYEDVQVRELRL